MARITPPRGALNSDTEGVGQTKEYNALTALLSEFNGNIDSTNLKAGTLGLASPYFRAYLSTGATLATGATVVFNTESDPNNWYNNATGVFLPTVAGTYRLSWAVATDSPITVGKFFGASLVGSFAVSGNVAFQAAAGTSIVSVGSVLLPFNGSTDAVHVIVGHNNVATVDISSTGRYTHFEADYLGV